MTALEKLNESNFNLDKTIQNAINRIAPAWPLDKNIAVNPFWGWVDSTFNSVAEKLERLGGIEMYMSNKYYHSQIMEDNIKPEHIAEALKQLNLKQSVDSVIINSRRPDQKSNHKILLCDYADISERVNYSWRELILNQISQFCSSYFDNHQAEWRFNYSDNLYSSWKENLKNDHSISLVTNTSFIHEKLKKLPNKSQETIDFVISNLELKSDLLEDYLVGLLLSVNGWASWCTYLNWHSKDKKLNDLYIFDLLAIRLAWEYLINDDKVIKAGQKNNWQNYLIETKNHKVDINKAVLQRALEISYQEQIIDKLNQTTSIENNSHKVLAVFCIDVRSERIRRAIEKQSSNIKTSGFAGFFGLPISYTPIGSNLNRPQLPGLLTAKITVTETTGDHNLDDKIKNSRTLNSNIRNAYSPFTKQPLSTFTLVETLGLTYLYKIIIRTLGLESQKLETFGIEKNVSKSLTTKLNITNIKEKAELAKKILSAMNLTKNFPKLVIFVAHSSQSTNNPHAASLECGACCGHSGEINARTLADLLNEIEIREELKILGLQIPETTKFIAGLHNTTTDQISLTDNNLEYSSHLKLFNETKANFDIASQLVREERAKELGLESVQNNNLFKIFKKRANDWSQTRPELGLANNASFIIAKRSRTKNINLEGRSFLHEYSWQDDSDGIILEQIMTAPMLVTNWINMQYYSSTVDNFKYGSGNKVLHNVVAGKIGVFEGNTGDLRIGLSQQSLYVNNKLTHQPLRLSVFIEAPNERIENIIRKHNIVGDLINNQWLFLFSIGKSGEIYSFQSGNWDLIKEKSKPGYENIFSNYTSL